MQLKMRTNQYTDESLLSIVPDFDLGLTLQ